MLQDNWYVKLVSLNRLSIWYEDGMIFYPQKEFRRSNFLLHVDLIFFNCKCVWAKVFFGKLTGNEQKLLTENRSFWNCWIFAHWFDSGGKLFFNARTLLANIDSTWRKKMILNSADWIILWRIPQRITQTLLVFESFRRICSTLSYLYLKNSAPKILLWILSFFPPSFLRHHHRNSH